MQAKLEGTTIDQRFKAREQSEEAATGRIDLNQFKEMMAQLQRHGRSDAAVRQLAQRFSLPAEVVQNVANHYSVPAVFNASTGGDYRMTGEWV